MKRYPGQLTVVCGVTTPSSSAAAAMTTLKRLPGEYWPWIARFIRGVSGSLVSRLHAAGSTPAAKTLGS